MNYLQKLIKDYVPKALRTEANPKLPIKALQLRRLRHAALGVCTEVAELAGNTDLVNGQEEVADTMWYLAVATDLLRSLGVKVKVVDYVCGPRDLSFVADYRDTLHYLFRLTGDLADYAKRWEFYGKEPNWLDVGFTVQQLWQTLHRMVKLLGGDVETCMTANIQKLRTRYPEKFTSDLAVTRNLKAERKVLEQNLTVKKSQRGRRQVRIRKPLVTGAYPLAYAPLPGTVRTEARTLRKQK